MKSASALLFFGYSNLKRTPISLFGIGVALTDGKSHRVGSARGHAIQINVTTYGGSGFSVACAQL